MAVQNAKTPDVIGRFTTVNLPHLTRKSRQATNWPPADERRRGSQGILLSIYETEMEQMTSHTREQHQTGNGNFRFQVGLKPTKMYKRALSSTYSSLPTPNQLLGVFHSTIQGSENVPQRFCCLESCLTALLFVENTCIDLASNQPSPGMTHCQIDCRIRLPREDREHCSSPPRRDLVANVSWVQLRCHIEKHSKRVRDVQLDAQSMKFPPF